MAANKNRRSEIRMLRNIRFNRGSMPAKISQGQGGP